VNEDRNSGTLTVTLGMRTELVIILWRCGQRQSTTVHRAVEMGKDCIMATGMEIEKLKLF